MDLKRIGIALPMLGLTGGINIALNWAAVLARDGRAVDLILPQSAGSPEIPFLDEADRGRLRVVPLPEAHRRHYDAAIAVWWESIATLADLHADRYAWLMQAVEAQFFERDDPARADHDALVSADLNIITTARWLRDHAQRHFGAPSERTSCVLSGLDRDLWRPAGRSHRGDGPVRFLVEGPPGDPRKNTLRTIRLLEGLKVPYAWVGASVDREAVGPHCERLESNVPYRRMPEVYGSRDVLVKASNAEGMFGPPLEMFATGGTAVAWHVQGAEEYMSHRHNALLPPLNSWSRLAEAVRELADSPGFVRDLQGQALATAEAWPSWDDQAEAILAAVDGLVPGDRASIVDRVASCQFRSIDDRLERERLRVRWLESEVAARDARIAELWEIADGRGRALDAIRAAPQGPGTFRRLGRFAKRAGRLLGSRVPGAP